MRSLIGNILQWGKQLDTVLSGWPDISLIILVVLLAVLRGAFNDALKSSGLIATLIRFIANLVLAFVIIVTIWVLATRHLPVDQILTQIGHVKALGV